MTRHRARELVLKCLYAYETLEDNPKLVFNQVCASTSLDVLGLQYVSNLYFAIVERMKDIDKVIKQHSANWDLNRLAVVDKNILRIAVCELFYFPDIPARVSMNEAIELAKTYSTMDSSSFVNGILDAIYRAHIIELEDGGKATE